MLDKPTVLPLKNGYTVKIEIHQDEYYDDFETKCLSVFHQEHKFHSEATRLGLTNIDLADMYVGDIVVTDDTIYIGLERYSHGGDVYALTREGNFPDREWDVSQLVGWASPDKEDDSDVIIPYLAGEEGSEGKLRERMRSYISVLNHISMGNCWLYVATVYDEKGGEVTSHSCGGYLGDPEVCLKEAMVEGIPIEYELAEPIEV